MPKNLIPNQFDYSGIYVEGERSQFRFNKGYKAGFMSGMLVPFGDPIRVFPGVKFDLQIVANIISDTMVAVPLDGLYVDFFAVWIPDRIVWTHQPQFLGENDQTAWTQNANYVYPSVSYGEINKVFDTYKPISAMPDVSLGNLSLFAHYGLIAGLTQTQLANKPVNSVAINMLAARGYYFAWNHLFRDENYQRPVLWSKTDVGDSGEFGYFLRDYDLGNDHTTYDIEETGVGLDSNKACLMPVNKLHDWATSVLPEPQYGNSIGLGVGVSAPVTLVGTGTSISAGQGLINLTAINNPGLSNGSAIASSNGSGTLLADLKNALGTINQFRANVMTQRFIEALARGGRRVPELYEAIWSVKNTKAIYDYPELLSHERYIMGVQQVVATADGEGSGWTSHLGDRGAYSLTVLRDVPVCEKDFTEFGYLHIFYCVRSTNQYSQILPEHFTRRVLLDEYNPYFDHIGDSAIPNYLVNVYAAESGNFGYQEAWWSERTQTNICCGALNKAFGSLSYHVIGEVFSDSLVTCTPGYLSFDPAVFNDVFVHNYSAYPQFLIDGVVKGKKVARMSQHSVPGIVGRI